MTDTDEKVRDLGTLTEMMAKGRKYREEFELEMFGVPVILQLRPIPDEEYIPIQLYMKEVLGMDEDEALDALDELRELDEGNVARVSNLDIEKPKEFAAVLNKVARLGIDAKAMDGSEEQLDELFDGAVGGYTLEIAYKVIEVTGTLRDAKKFRGIRAGE